MGYQEDGRHLCTLAGYGGDTCPEDLEGYLRFARSLPSPVLYDVLKDAETLDEPRAYGAPSNLWRRYDRMRAFPAGLLAMGDSVCSFDPIYGQGMTVAALEAEALGNWLRKPGASAKRWFESLAPIIRIPWTICTGGAAHVMGLPESKGGVAGFMNWYLDRLHACAATDPQVADAFLSVAHMCRSPASLFRPGVSWRVLRGSGGAVGAVNHPA